MYLNFQQFYRRNYFWECRSNLHGHQFVAAIDHWKPFVYDIQGFQNTYKAVGLNIDVLEELEKLLNFSTIFVKGNDSWSNMVDQVHRKQLDFAATGFSQVHSFIYFIYSSTYLYF